VDKRCFSSPWVGRRPMIPPVEIVETHGARPEAEILPVALVPPVAPQQEGHQGTSLQKRWPVAAMAGALVTLLATASLALFFPFPGVAATPHPATRGCRSLISPTRQLRLRCRRMDAWLRSFAGRRPLSPLARFT
jgi:hypothetical protein